MFSKITKQTRCLLDSHKMKIVKLQTSPSFYVRSSNNRHSMQKQKNHSISQNSANNSIDKAFQSNTHNNEDEVADDDAEVDINSSNVFTELPKLRCKGCGVKLQISEPYEEGYIDYAYLSKFLANRIKTADETGEKLERDLKKYLRAYKETARNISNNDNLVEDKDQAENVSPEGLSQQHVETEERFFSEFWKKKYVKGVNCFRCQKIKNNQIEDIFNISTRIKGKLRSSSKRKIIKSLTETNK